MRFAGRTPNAVIFFLTIGQPLPTLFRGHRKLNNCIRFTSFGKFAIEALACAIADAKEYDPLQPVSVVTPAGVGVYSGLHARRRLTLGGLDLNLKTLGLTNVRFLPLARVAELLGETQLTATGKRKLTDPLRREFARAALAQQPGSLQKYAHNPAVLSSLLQAFQTLASLGHAARLELEGSSVVSARDTARLYSHYRRETLARDFYDDADAMSAAAAAVRNGEPDPDIGHVILYLPSGADTAERELLQALKSQSRLTVLIGQTGEAEADREALDLARELDPSCAQIVFPACDIDCNAVVVVTDAEEELRAAISGIRQALTTQNTPLWRTAILYRLSDPYAAIGAERLKAAGLASFTRPAQTLAQTLPGRALLGALKVHRDKFSGTSVRDWLRATPLHAPGHNGAAGRALRVSTLEAALGRAGAVKGIGDWLNALDAAMKSRKADMRERTEHRGEIVEETILDDDSRIRELKELREYLVAAVERPDPTADANWQGWAGWANKLLLRIAEQDLAVYGWTDDDVSAHALVQEAVERLGVLDIVERAITEEEFVAEVEYALSASVKDPEARYGMGVFVGTLEDAWGLDFDQIYIVGTHDGALPPRSRPDPLLPPRALGTDEALSQIGERRVFLAACKSARKVTYMFARSDRRAGRSCQPSRWLLAEMQHLHGKAVHSADLEGSGRIEADWLVRWDSFNHAVRQREPGCEQEFDLRSLADGGCVDSDALKAANAMLQARGDSILTSHDGFVGPGLYHPGTGPFSATRLETFAACPFQYFLKIVLKLDEPDRDEEPFLPNALERGKLIHEVLQRFYVDRKKKGMPMPSTAWDAEATECLKDITATAFTRFEADGKITRTPLWEAEKRRIQSDMEQLLLKDSIQRLRDQTTPMQFEQGFGDDSTVSLGGENLITFHGQIDRMDVGADGKTLIIDYKSGSKTRYDAITQSNPVNSGRSLQLAIYALAAEAKGYEKITSRYWFATSKGEFKEKDFIWDATTRQQLTAAVQLIVGGMRAGSFPAVPGKADRGSFKNCCTCSYDRVCSADRDTERDAKQNDPNTAFLIALSGPTVVGGNGN